MLSGNPATSENRQSASWKLLRRCNSLQARGGSDGHAGSSASGGEGVLNGGEENRTDDEVSFKVKKMDIAGDSESMQSFKTRLDNFKAKFNQDGGKKDKSTPSILISNNKATTTGIAIDAAIINLLNPLFGCCVFNVVLIL